MPRPPQNPAPDNHPWLPIELQRIHDLADDHPPGLILRHYNHWASRFGFHTRSQQQVIQAAATHLNLIDWIPTGYWILDRDLAAMLEIPRHVILSWVHNEKIAHHIEPAGRIYLRRATFTYLARHRPEFLAAPRPSRFGLFSLLGADFLVKNVLKAQAAIPKTTKPRPVQRIEDCRWWPTPSLAAASCDILPQQVIESASSNLPTPAGSFRFVSVPVRHIRRGLR
jgi:hypothetical protein